MAWFGSHWSEAQIIGFPMRRLILIKDSASIFVAVHFRVICVTSEKKPMAVGLTVFAKVCTHYKELNCLIQK